MALERKATPVMATSPRVEVVSFGITFTASGTTWAATSGDKSLITSVSNTSTGLITIVLKQVGYSLIGCSIMPETVGTPGATKVCSAVMKSFTSSTKTLVISTLKGDGAVVDSDDGGKLYITLIFKDTVSS